MTYDLTLGDFGFALVEGTDVYRTYSIHAGVCTGEISLMKAMALLAALEAKAAQA